MPRVPFVTLICLLAAPLSAAAGNLLVNAGAEDGSLGPWSTSGGLTFFVQTGSVTAGGTINATEGTRWFRAPGSASAGAEGFLDQVVDVRAFNFSSGTVQVTYGGDSMGISTRSPPASSTNARYLLEFLDASQSLISTVSSGNVMSQQGSPEQTLDHRSTATAPTNTEFIRFRAGGFEGTFSTTSNGFDDLFLELDASATAPEPGAATLCLAGVVLARRTRRRRA